MQKRFSQRNVNTLASAECELSVDHITGHPVETSGWKACNVCLAQCASYSMNVVVHIGKQRLSKPRNCHLPEQNDDLRFCLPCRYLPAKKVNGDARGRPSQRIVRRRRDRRRSIPYRTRGTVARPASGHSCRPTSLQWRTRRTAFFFTSSFSRNLQQRWSLRSGRPGSLRTWRDGRACYPCPAQLLRFLKSSKCACVKISASSWGIRGDVCSIQKFIFYLCSSLLFHFQYTQQNIDIKMIHLYFDIRHWRHSYVKTRCIRSNLKKKKHQKKTYWTPMGRC